MTFQRVCCLLVGAVLLTSSSTAQTADTARAARMVRSVQENIRRNQTLPDSLRRLTAEELVSQSNTRHIVLLDDASSALMLRAIAATLHRLPEPLCGSFLTTGGPGGDLNLLIPYADSATLHDWATVLQRIVEARARGASAGRPATQAEVQAATLGVFGRLSAPDQQRFMTIAMHPPPSQPDACWAMRVTMDGLAAMSAADAGPIVRAMFGRSAQAR